MTDRHVGYIVTLEQDVREDDAEESVLTALRMVKGVLSVQPIINDREVAIAQSRLKYEVGQKFYEFYNDTFREW